MKRYKPDEFETACQFDEAIRSVGGKKFRAMKTKYEGEQYVHSSLKPLREVKFKHEDEVELWDMKNECTGMCGS